MVARIYDWFVDRATLSRHDVRHFALHEVPPWATWKNLFGGVTLFLAICLFATGPLLAIYYRPTAATAYASVQRIIHEIPFGWAIRQMHAWCANLLVLMVFVHMLRVLAHGAFRPPRELTWLSGVVLMMLTLGEAFTGYLLPWDQLAYWATTVGTDMAGAVPFAGPHMLELLRGGAEVSESTLGRFFVAHAVIIPGLLAAFIAGHLTLVWRRGVSERV